MPLNPHHREKIEQLLRAVEISALPAGQLSEPVSDELADLLWLFAEDELSAAEEERLWELAAQQPAAVGYFQSVLSAIEKQEAESLDSLPQRVVQRLAKNEKSPATSPLSPRGALQRGLSQLSSQVTSLTQFVADISVEVARDFLRNLQSTPPPLGTSAARSSAERPTTLVQTLLKRIGLLEITIDHAGKGLCHLTIRIVEPSRNHPDADLRVSVDRGQERFREPQLFESRAVRFPDLPAEDYTLVIQGKQGEVERICISLRSPLRAQDH